MNPEISSFHMVDPLSHSKYLVYFEQGHYPSTNLWKSDARYEGCFIIDFICEHLSKQVAGIFLE